MGRNLKVAAVLALGGAAAYRWRREARDKPRADEPDRIGYPPRDTLKKVCEDIWIVDSGPIRAAGLSMPIRMTAIRLQGGDLLLHSPTRITDALVAELGKVGKVRHLVAPTVGHWSFLTEWQKAFPHAEVWAVPGLRKRPQVRLSGLRIDHDLSRETPEAWANDIGQWLVQGGGGFKEAYFLHRATRTLVLADLVQNLEGSKLPPLTALVAELARATRGQTAAHVRLAIALGGARPKEQIRHLTSLQPDRVIFAHGSWFESNAAERLRRAFDWLR